MAYGDGLLPDSDIKAVPSDRRPAILICSWDAAEPLWDLVEDLSGDPWNPPGARSVLVPGDDAEPLIEHLADRLRTPDARALLLLGRTRHDGPLRLQIRAENRQGERGQRLVSQGPGVVRATAPATDILQALAAAGTPAVAASEAEEDAGSVILYRILAGLADGDAPAIGLLRFPAGASELSVRQAVKAAATAMTQHLTPLPRPRAA